jgi:hypothetical protein
VAGELNTEVQDDAAGCRALAEYLRKVAKSADEANQVFTRVQTDSEHLWTGRAGMAFRAAQEPNARDSNEVGKAAATYAVALDAFAADIDTVKARMSQARDVARQAGLITTSTVILPPGPGPSPHQTNGVPQTSNAFLPPQTVQQLAEHQQKQRTFEEVSGTVADARRIQAEAHNELETAVEDPLATLKTTKTWTMFVVGNGLSYVKASQTTANDLVKQADALDAKALEYQRKAWETDDPLLQRQYAASYEGFQREAVRAQSLSETLQRPIDAIPEGVRQRIEMNPGNSLEGETGWLKLGKGAARGVPLIGTGLTVASGVTDWAMGKPAGQAAGETTGSLAGGVVGGMAGAESGAAIGGAMGTVVPIAGNAAGAAIGGVVGGVAGGIIGSLSGTQAADNLMGVKQ